MALTAAITARVFDNLSGPATIMARAFHHEETLLGPHFTMAVTHTTGGWGTAFACAGTGTCFAGDRAGQIDLTLCALIGLFEGYFNFNA